MKGQLELMPLPQPEPVRRVRLTTALPHWLPPAVAHAAAD